MSMYGPSTRLCEGLEFRVHRKFAAENLTFNVVSSMAQFLAKNTYSDNHIDQPTTCVNPTTPPNDPGFRFNV